MQGENHPQTAAGPHGPCAAGRLAEPLPDPTSPPWALCHSCSVGLALSYDPGCGWAQHLTHSPRAPFVKRTVFLIRLMRESTVIFCL